MKKIVPFVVAGLVLAAGLVAPRVNARPQDSKTLEQRVAALEQSLGKQKQENQDLHARLEQTIAYLDKMTKSGQLLLSQLDQVEALGFTSGINYQSRELMLKAMREYWGAQQEGLPAAAPEPGEAKEGGPVVRQRQ